MYVVSTPIGNLGDLSHRAVEVLGSVSAILAEDTRRTRHLLEHYGVKTRMVAYHEHNEAQMVPRVLSRLSRGQDLALVSDAGTPLLSDPGSRVVDAAIAAGVTVVPIPGASALLAALSAAGVPAETFTFYGFLARAGRARQEVLEELSRSRRAAVIYESPNRVADTLADIATHGAADRQAVVGRELTKRFEEFRRGTVAGLASVYADDQPKGEVVIVIAGAPEPSLDTNELMDVAARLREQGMSPRDITRALVEEHGAPRNFAYKLGHRSSP